MTLRVWTYNSEHVNEAWTVCLEAKNRQLAGDPTAAEDLTRGMEMLTAAIKEKRKAA